MGEGGGGAAHKKYLKSWWLAGMMSGWLLKAMLRTANIKNILILNFGISLSKTNLVVYLLKRPKILLPSKRPSF